MDPGREICQESFFDIVTLGGPLGTYIGPQDGLDTGFERISTPSFEWIIRILIFLSKNLFSSTFIFILQCFEFHMPSKTYYFRLFFDFFLCLLHALTGYMDLFHHCAADKMSCKQFLCKKKVFLYAKKKTFQCFPMFTSTIFRLRR